ncbi:hypothetical protein [Streptomyces pseudovenezuelae]|uniref:Uncharacterized protein n=1 Tax=Streptomyces pseudovenezuelae TaxID=67350 RepID=A0ABZ1WWA1_9ACTN|nr:hypothetical protein [Streptomyces pseudovenezuelae]
MRKRLPSLRSALRLPGRQTATRALVAAVLAAAVVAQAVAALRPHVPPLLAATAASLAVEGVLHRGRLGDAHAAGVSTLRALRTARRSNWSTPTSR